MTLFRPVLMSGLDRGPGDVRLAGGWCWFNPGSTLPDELARLTAPRTAVAGQSMDRPRSMGILNVTPDSYSDGGELAPVAAAAGTGLAASAGGTPKAVSLASTRRR